MDEEEVVASLMTRVPLFVKLPLADLDKTAIEREIDAIGAETPKAHAP